MWQRYNEYKSFSDLQLCSFSWACAHYRLGFFVLGCQEWNPMWCCAVVAFQMVFSSPWLQTGYLSSGSLSRLSDPVWPFSSDVSYQQGISIISAHGTGLHWMLLFFALLCVWICSVWKSQDISRSWNTQIIPSGTNSHTNSPWAHLSPILMSDVNS